MPQRFAPESLARVTAEIDALHAEMSFVEDALAAELSQVASSRRPSARNMAHYLALRNHDLRPLQRELSALGLSSLGRAESHVLATVSAVRAALHERTGTQPTERIELPVDFHTGPEALREHTLALLGAAPAHRSTHIMVTMPGAAAEDERLVRSLIDAGTGLVRLNCAHDDPETWARIVAHVRAAERATGRRCRVLMDLPGPKLRTTGLAEGPRTIHVRPERGPRGEVVEPARVLWFREGTPIPPDAPRHDVHVPLEGDAWSDLSVEDLLVVRDLRGRLRAVRVASRGREHAFSELHDSVWLETGTAMAVVRDGTECAQVRVGTLPPRESTVRLARGDHLWIVPEGAPCGPAEAALPARVGCTLPEVFRDVRPGEPIHFDDGKITGRVLAVVSSGANAPRIEVEITAPATGAVRLGCDKGINLPATNLGLPALTAHDAGLLPHVARHADMVGLSFVRSASDVRELVDRLNGLGRPDLGVVLKIETAQAFADLPNLLLAGLRTQNLGVMVARGDLGVELGFERLAEVQEEILWLCEAAHVPVIWATQVLENLTKRGQPSRAEVTDAAMSARAECVMLNKGPYVLESVRFLDDVLHRMQDHQQKKSATLRRLSVSRLAREALATDRS